LDQTAHRQNDLTATIALRRGSRLSATATVRSKRVEESLTNGDYLSLCSPAAVWAQYAIARELHQKVAAEDAESYSLVRDGLDAMDAGNLVSAIKLFDQAIAIQPRNWPAHVNLVAALRIYFPDRATAARVKAAMDEMRRTVQTT
jgi:hypothetical protein